MFCKGYGFENDYLIDSFLTLSLLFYFFLQRKIRYFALDFLDLAKFAIFDIIVIAEL